MGAALGARLENSPTFLVSRGFVRVTHALEMALRQLDERGPIRRIAEMASRFYEAFVPISAVIFDVDGVLVDSPHERAWRDTLFELMRGPWAEIAAQSTYSPERFDGALYQRFVAGKPRTDGARSILEYFAVPEAHERAAEYAREKQNKVVALIEAGDFHPFPDAIAFVKDTLRLGLPIAAASSSKNAGKLLGLIPVNAPSVCPGSTLRDLFDADLSGRDFPRGKPAPDIFLTAARELGIDPHQCVVVEDAVAGILAAKAGGMFALGVARVGDDEGLRAAGADLVVRSLEEVSRRALTQGKLEAAVIAELAA